MSDKTPDTTGLREVPDLLAALQRSVDAAKAARAAHPTPDASPVPAVVTPDAGDVEALAWAINDAEDGGKTTPTYTEMARHILASDWLANHVAQVARTAAKEERERARVMRDAVERLADIIHGDSGWEHNSGCEGEPDCFACIEADLRRIAREEGRADD